MAHLKYAILLNYLEDQLPVEERSKVDIHLAEPCWECARRLALLRTALRSMTEDRTVAPPEAILKRAVDIVRSRRDLPERKPWMRVVAALRFDSHLQLSSAATRGATRTRQMLFTTEQVDIDLQIKPGRADNDLLGQMLSARRSGQALPAFVSLQNSAGTLLRATETDALGQFAFRQIPSGRYDLIFDLENQEVAITGLEFEND
ncbi:MAG TPA: hypothetical protein VLE49_04610 [Anaerolineales bacterium]|nr:hypothetical protein [Anaerolineales bacterium]